MLCLIGLDLSDPILFRCLIFPFFFRFSVSLGHFFSQCSVILDWNAYFLYKWIPQISVWDTFLRGSFFFYLLSLSLILCWWIQLNRSFFPSFFLLLLLHWIWNWDSRWRSPPATWFVCIGHDIKASKNKGINMDGQKEWSLFGKFIFFSTLKSQKWNCFSISKPIKSTRNVRTEVFELWICSRSKHL